MIETERSEQWVRARAERRLDEFERLVRTETHPNKAYIASWGLKYTALGFVCSAPLLCNERLLSFLLENGADPLAKSCVGETRHCDAFELAYYNNLNVAFFTMLEYTPLTPHNFTLWNDWRERVEARRHRNAAGHVLAWLFTHIGHTEQIEPAVQRLAKIPLDCWIVRRLGGGQSSVKKLKK
jgi:hypothetical protein